MVEKKASTMKKNKSNVSQPTQPVTAGFLSKFRSVVHRKQNKLKRRDFISAGVGTLLAAFIAVILWIADYYRDQPNLQVTISAGTPVFRMHDKEEWSTDRYKAVITEGLDFLLASFVAKSLQQKGLLSNSAADSINKRAGTFSGQIESIKMRVPLHIRVSNNGRRATTIVSGRFLIHDDLRQEPFVSQFQDIKEHIGASEVRDLTKKELVFIGRQSIPPSVSIEAAIGIASNWVDTHSSLGMSSEDNLKFQKYIFSEIGQNLKKATGKDFQYGFKIEIELMDQFGETVKGSTGTIHLDEIFKVK